MLFELFFSRFFDCKYFFVALSTGDPTVFGNLPPAQEILDAMKEVLDENHFNGYAPSVGYTEARQAVADYSAHQVIKGRGITANDVRKLDLIV